MDQWDKVVGSLGPPLLRLATRIVGNNADAEDLVQMAFLEAHQFSQRAYIKNWQALLRQIVTHRAYDLLRRKQRTKESCSDFDVTNLSASPTEQLEAQELIERLQEAVCQLPNQQARIFWLRYFDGCSNGEIADALDISKHGVSAALNKARTALAPKFFNSTCRNEDE